MALIISCLSYLCLLPHPASGYNAKPASMYYVKLQVISSGGTIIKSNLEMTPSDEEFRADNFEIIRVAGYSDRDNNNDIDSAAKHDAISRVLSIYGLKSISSKNELSDFKSKDITVMNYQGAVKYPFKILNRSYLKNGSTYRVLMEVNFSPIALPSKWTYLYMASKIKQSFIDTCALFYKDIY